MQAKRPTTASKEPAHIDIDIAFSDFNKGTTNDERGQ